jgi:phosphatidylserine synthase
MSTLKHKGKGPQAMTANELRSGLSVWMTAEFSWSQNYADALLTENDVVIEKMDETAKAAELANTVVGAYFIDTVDGKPARYRERFRTHGPSYDTADLISGDTA